MNKTDLLRTLKSLFLITIPKALLFYVLVPLLCLVFLAQPIADTVRVSDPAAFRILLAALAAIGLNWLVYARIRRKRPSFLVFAYGVICLLAVVITQYEALPSDSAMKSTMAFIGGSLALISLILLGYWFAWRQSRPAHVIAVGLWIVFGLILFFMVLQILRDIEIRHMTRDTWITIGILAVILVASQGPKILSSFRRASSRRRSTGLATGTIVRIVGETHLDLDDDLVTMFHAFIQYTVQDTSYEIRADVTRHTLRRYGKENFIGRKIPVFYNPEDPADAFADRIDKRIFDQQC